MALVVTFRLPVETCTILSTKTGDDLRADIKKCLIDGVLSNTPISTTEVSLDIPTERFNLSVSEEIGTSVRQKAGELGVSARQVCQGILLSLSARNTQNPASPSPEFAVILSTLKASGDNVTDRPEQSTFYSYLIDALASGALGLCEAGTGTGKTLAMLAAAKHTLERAPETRLVIACPSLMLMEQFALHYNSMQVAGIAMPYLRIVIGRREFVSPTEVRRIAESGTLDADLDVAAVLKWVDEGGQPDSSHWYDMSWLASSLYKIAPGFPVAAASIPDAMDGSELDPGLIAYRSQFQVIDDRTDEIILCTHAMLAIDVRQRMFAAGRDLDYRDMRKTINDMFSSMTDLDEYGRKVLSKDIRERRKESLLHGAQMSADAGRLPPFHFLMIDEAHLLEQAFSNSLSSYVSLQSFLGELEAFRSDGGRISAKSVKEVASKIAKLKMLAMSDTISLSDGSPAAQAVTDALKEIVYFAGVIKSISSTGDHRLNRLKRELNMISIASERYAYSRAFIQYSPVRAYPQLYIGAPSVDNALSFLWAGCRAGVCVSATLYLPRGEGFSAAYQAGLLSIPQDRQREYQPVVPLWTYTTVEGVYFPENVHAHDGRLWLRPPTRSDKLNNAKREEAERAWIFDLAGAVNRIHEDSAGGTLVLLTSYVSVTELAAVLPSNLKVALVAADKDSSLAAQRKRFLTHVRNGHKPIWLAVGNAWTGLDVGGHKPWFELFKETLPAEQDNALTTLVIAKLPFGTNKSVTHMTRMERNASVPWEVLDVFFRTKQAMGRLVRRGNLPQNRRIYILDGRINDPSFGGYLSRIHALVKGYAHKILKCA